MFALVTLIFSIVPHAFALDISVGSNPSQSTLARVGLIEGSFLVPGLRSFSTEGLSVVIDKDLSEPRAQIKGKRIAVSADILRDTEFLTLFIHEFAHYVDLYILQKKGILTDPSSEFYEISWKTSDIKRTDAKREDFVTGYAATNQYEDFAESFVFYIFHNADFIDLAMRSEPMRQKYLFFRTVVFPGGEFEDTDFTVGQPEPYSWDSTKIPFSIKKYLFFYR